MEQTLAIGRERGSVSKHVRSVLMYTTEPRVQKVTSMGKKRTYRWAAVKKVEVLRRLDSALADKSRGALAVSLPFCRPIAGYCDCCSRLGQPGKASNYASGIGR